MTNETNGETFALETRVEELTYLSGDRRVRRGESDRLEVGSGPAQDIVSGTEHTRIGGHLSEHTGGNLSAQASRMETTVEGKLTQRFKSNTTLLGGAMTEVYTGGVFIGAGMSDDLVIGGGVRVTAPADLWLCGLIGMEEKIGSACADGALLELYRLAFEREYATGVHAAGAAVFSGTVHATLATGFRQLFKVSRGVRDLTPGGNAEGGDAPAPPAAPAPAPAPGGEAGSSGALLAQGATGMEEAEDLAALEDIRHLFGDLDTTVDSGRTGDRAALLEDLGSLAKHSETGEDVGDTGALANRLQEGAGLGDVVDAEDLRAMLGLDEGPETLDEARLVPDEVVDSQMLDDDGNWVERVCIDPVEPEVRYEHLLGPGNPPNPPDRRQFEQHGAALGIPEDFDFERARTDFNWRLETKFRPDATLDTSETGRCDGAWLEAVVSGEFEQRGMEPDGVAAAFEHDAFPVVVQKDPCRAPEHGERLDVAADEVGERGAEVEAHEGISGVTQHQDERHQGAFGASDRKLAEVRPVDLRLLARKGAKAQIRFTGPAWAQLRDAVTEVVGATGIAARCDHVEQPRGGQGGEAFQRLGEPSEGAAKRLDARRPPDAPSHILWFQPPVVRHLCAGLRRRLE